MKLWAFREHTDHGEAVALHSRPCSDFSMSRDGKAGRAVWAVKARDGCGGEEVDRCPMKVGFTKVGQERQPS